MLDERLVTTLHVEALRRRGLHAEHEPHLLFQASTIASLLDGAYDGDLTFAELAEHGDLGLGTLNRLDGEMIAVDGRFYRADLDGRMEEIDPGARTPFAVVVFFSPTVDVTIGSAADALEAVERHRPSGARCGSTARSSWSALARSRAKVPRTVPSPKWRPSRTCSSWRT